MERGGDSLQNEDREIKVVKQKKFAEIFATLCLSPVSATPAMNHLQQYQLAYTLNKNHFMSVNSNLTASQQNMERLLSQFFFSFIAGVDTDDKSLLSNISANFRKNSKWPPWYILRGPGETDS